MQDTSRKPEQQSPAEIAREAFRRLAARRMPPTPDAYREVYDEVAGIKEQPAAEKVLADFAANLANAPDELAQIARQFAYALKMRDWQKCSKQLAQLAEKHMMRASPAATEEASKVDNAEASPVAKTAIPLVDTPEQRPRSASIPLVDDPEPPHNTVGTIALVDSDSSPTTQEEEESVEFGTPHSRLLREMLVRTWTLAVASLLQEAPEMAKEAEAIAEEIKLARSLKDLIEIGARLKQLCFKIEQKSGDLAEKHELLLRLFKLLLENIGELSDDDSWLSGQVATIQALLSGPIDHAVLVAVTHHLKDVIYKQSLLKQSLQEAKATLKNMMLTFIDRVSAIADSAGSYHEKIDTYSQQIAGAKDVIDLNKVLDHVMFDTRVAQADAIRAREQMDAVRGEVEAAENRIHKLESELVELSELAREDELTGSLNRRGLDEILEREIAYSNRKNTPLCVALLDLDDFKKLNDTHGHSAGDGALIHLVRVVKETLRAMGVIARFGGEEFLIVLPHTPMEDAVQTVTRVQRELTKQIFMHENQRLLITFSAGVAQRKTGEEQATLIQRADEAAYKAKRAGKNRVVVAE